MSLTGNTQDILRQGLLGTGLSAQATQDLLRQIFASLSPGDSEVTWTTTQSGITAITDLTGASLPTITVTAGGPVADIDLWVPDIAMPFASVNAVPRISICLSDNTQLAFGPTFVSSSAGQTANKCQAWARHRISASGTYDLKGRIQMLSGTATSITSLPGGTSTTTGRMRCRWNYSAVAT